MNYNWPNEDPDDVGVDVELDRAALDAQRERWRRTVRIAVAIGLPAATVAAGTTIYSINAMLMTSGVAWAFSGLIFILYVIVFSLLIDIWRDNAPTHDGRRHDDGDDAV